MKKIILMTMIVLGVFSFSKTTSTTKKSTTTVNSDKQAAMNSFYEFMNFYKNPENIRRQTLGNSIEGTNEILGSSVNSKDKVNLKKAADSQTNKSLENAVAYLTIANSKITYTVKNVEVKNGTAILTVHMKGPNFTAHSNELKNYVQKKTTENKSKLAKMTQYEYQNFLAEKISEFYLNLVKSNNLKYMESDIKVHTKKYSNKWGVVQDYKLNNSLYKFLGFGFGPELR